MIINEIFFADRYHFAEPHKVNVHTHPGSQLEVVEKGEITYVDAQGERVMKTGDIVWIESQWPHGWHNSKKVTALTFKFELGEKDDNEWRSIIQNINEDPWTLESIRRAAKWWNTQGPELEDAACHLLGALFARAMSGHRESAISTDPGWELLKSDLDSAEGEMIEVEKLAARMNLSVPHFRRKFLGLFGDNPFKYQVKVRMKRARDMLLYTSMQVQEIADRCGYADLAGFSKAYARVNGERPIVTRTNRARESGPYK